MKQRSMDGNKKTGKILFEAGILIMVVNLVSAIGIWQSILHGWKVSQGGELFFQAFIQSGGNYVITYLNQESIYISFLSVLFSFLGNKEEIVSIINLILQLAGISFFYLGAKKLFRFVFPLAIVVICGLLSVCFYPVVSDSSMHIIWCLSGLIFWIGSLSFNEQTGKFLKRILLGVLLGIFCYMDMAGFFLSVTLILLILIAGEFNFKEKKVQFLHFIYFLLGVINGFFVMFYLWNNFQFNNVVFQYWLNDKLSYFAQETGLNQYISLGLVLIVNIIFFAIKRSRKVVVTPMAEASTLQESTVEINTEAETNVEVETTTNVAVAISAETETINEVQESIVEEKKPIKFIDNPLPLPKKHVKKEMNYAFEPTKDQMHYDLNNYRLDDDYDLKDI